MNLSQLQQGLEQAFYTEQHRIVFWYDAEQSFTEEIKALSLIRYQKKSSVNARSMVTL
jgi:hypothetical protein